MCVWGVTRRSLSALEDTRSTDDQSHTLSQTPSRGREKSISETSQGVIDELAAPVAHAGDSLERPWWGHMDAALVQVRASASRAAARPCLLHIFAAGEEWRYDGARRRTAAELVPACW